MRRPAVPSRPWLQGAVITLWLALLAAGQVAAEVAPIEGVWVTADGDGWIEIRRDGDEWHGVIVGPSDDGRLDVENPDTGLRDRPLFGLRILDGFTRDGDGAYSGGTIYDPNNGKTYRCTLELEGPDTLKVRGFIGVSLFGRTERWTRRTGDG